MYRLIDYFVFNAVSTGFQSNDHGCIILISESQSSLSMCLLYFIWKKGIHDFPITNENVCIILTLTNV